MRHIVFTLVLLVLAACGSSKEEHLARAQEYIAKADFEAASSELESALQQDSMSAEIRWLLGTVYLDTGHAPEAEYELQQAQRLGRPKDDILPAMAQALLNQGKFEEVLALDSRNLSATAAAHLLSTQALAAVSSNQVAKAQELANLAFRKAPQLPQVKLAVAAIRVHRGALANALVLIDSVLDSDPDSGRAWGLKGQVLAQQGKLEQARVAFDKSITHSHTPLADHVSRGLINLQLRDFAAAEVDAKALLELSPNDPAANYIKGLIDFEKKQYRKAISTLTLAEVAAQQFPLVQYYLSMGYLIENDLDPAEKYGKLYLKSTPDDGKGRKLLAAILIRQNKFAEALEVLQPVLDHDSDDIAALNIWANTLLLDGQADKGFALYERMAKLQGDWPVAPLRQEAGLVTWGPGGELVTATAAVSGETENFPQTDILLILKYLKNKSFQAAIDAAKSYQFRDIESVAPYAVLGRVYHAAGQPVKALDVYTKALNREPVDIAVNQGLARVELAAKNPNAARRYYQTILDAHEHDLDTLLLLADLEAKQKNTAAMLAALQEAAVAHRDALEPRLKLARYYLTMERPEKVAPQFAKLSGLQQTAPRVLEITTLAYLALEDYDSALVSLGLLVDAKPHVVNYHYLLATVAAQTGDMLIATEQLLDVVKRDPKHQPALIELARIMHSGGKMQQFKHYVATLATLAPNAPDVLRLRSLAATADGNHREALALAQQAFKLTPTTQTLLELNNCQKAAGFKGVARNLLQQWLVSHPTDVNARLVLANELALENNSAGARVQYTAILAQQPNNIQALNKLAENLRVDNPVLALATIRRALVIAPEQPELFDTLAIIELQTGDYESAQRSIQRALRSSPGNPRMRFHQAQIKTARGKKAQAIAILEELTAPGTDAFPEQAEAKKLLLSLKD